MPPRNMRPLPGVNSLTQESPTLSCLEDNIYKTIGITLCPWQITMLKACIDLENNVKFHAKTGILTAPVNSGKSYIMTALSLINTLPYQNTKLTLFNKNHIENIDKNLIITDNPLKWQKHLEFNALYVINEYTMDTHYNRIIIDQLDTIKSIPDASFVWCIVRGEINTKNLPFITGGYEYLPHVEIVVGHNDAQTFYDPLINYNEVKMIKHIMLDFHKHIAYDINAEISENRHLLYHIFDENILRNYSYLCRCKWFINKTMCENCKTENNITYRPSQVSKIFNVLNIISGAPDNAFILIVSTMTAGNKKRLKKELVDNNMRLENLTNKTKIKKATIYHVDYKLLHTLTSEIMDKVTDIICYSRMTIKLQTRTTPLNHWMIYYENENIKN